MISAPLVAALLRFVAALAYLTLPIAYGRAVESPTTRGSVVTGPIDFVFLKRSAMANFRILPRFIEFGGLGECRRGGKNYRSKHCPRSFSSNGL